MRHTKDTIGNETHDLPACTAVPPPTAQPRASMCLYIKHVLYCGRVPAANAPEGTAVQTLVFSRSYLHRQVSPPETLVVRGELLGREIADEFCLKMPDFHVTFRDPLHAVNLRHGTKGFTSFPKEGVLRIFSP